MSEMFYTLCGMLPDTLLARLGMFSLSCFSYKRDQQLVMLEWIEFMGACCGEKQITKVGCEIIQRSLGWYSAISLSFTVTVGSTKIPSGLNTDDDDAKLMIAMTVNLFVFGLWINDDNFASA